MKSLHSLMLLALLPVFAACSAQNEAPVVAPAAEPTPLTAAVEAPPTEPTAPATTNEPAAAPVAAAAPSGPPPVAGTDYVEIPGGAPFAAGTGKLEVAEVFGYTCPHCAQFEPIMRAWKRTQPADVNVITVPAAFGGYWETYARAYYAAETLGVLDRSHDAMFNALHVQRRLGLDSTPEQIGAFYAQYGVDPKTFASTMKSFPVETKLNRAKQFAMRSRIEGTPSIVVDGKYLVSTDQRGPEHMFNTIEHLLARGRAGGG